MNRNRSLLFWGGFLGLVLSPTIDLEAQVAIEKRSVARGNRLALIVGVGESKIGLTPLPACIQDAKRVDAVFKNLGYRTALHHDESAEHPPTLEAVTASLREVTGAAGQEDQVVVFFSCHGGISRNEPHVFLQDAPLSLRTIKKALAESKALVRVVLLDACRAERGFHTESSEFRDVHVVLSCRPDETSLVGPRGLSVFTEVLLEAFQDCRADRVLDGQLELDELLYYLDAEVPKRARQAESSHNQNPTRTVVDPRFNNPILGICRSLGAALPAASSQPVAFREPVRPAGSNDAILPAGLVGRVRIGMSVEEFVRQNRPAQAGLAGYVDQYGNGNADYDEKYLGVKGASVLVDFQRGAVSSIAYNKPLPIRTKPSLEQAEQGFKRLSSGLRHTELSAAWRGISAQRLAEELGPPDTRLLPGGDSLSHDGGGSWLYTIRGIDSYSEDDDQPNLAVSFTSFLIDLVQVYKRYPSEQSLSREAAEAKARQGFAKLTQNRPLALAGEMLKGISVDRILSEMKLPAGKWFSTDQFGDGSLSYDDVPKVHHTVDFEIKNFRVAEVTITISVPYVFKSEMNLDKARAGFHRLCAGKSPQQIESVFRGMSPQQIEANLGASDPENEMFDSKEGTSTWRFFGVPRENEFLTFEFSHWKVSNVSWRRPIP